MKRSLRGIYLLFAHVTLLGLSHALAQTPPPPSHDSKPESARADDAIATESPPMFPATRRSGLLVVEVVDAIGAPAADVGVHLDSRIGGHFGDLAIADDRNVHRELHTDGAGRVAIPELAEGAWSITARTDDGRAAREFFDFSLAQAEVPLRITLSEKPQRPPGVEIAVVGRDGSPVADAQVELFGATLDRGMVGPPSHPALTARSDAKGIARFDGVRWISGMAIASAPDSRAGAVAFGGVDQDELIDDSQPLVEYRDRTVDESRASLDDEYLDRYLLLSRVDLLSRADDFDGNGTERPTDEDSVSSRLVVGVPGGIAGDIELLPDSAASDPLLAGATIEAWLATGQIPWKTSYGRGTTVHVEGRKFAFDGLPPGSYSLALHAPGGARLVLDRAVESSVDSTVELENSVAPPVVRIEPGATARVTLHAKVGGTIHGRVHRADGSPIAGARVVDTFGPWRFEAGDAFVRQQMHVWSFGRDSGLEGLHPLTHVVGRTDSNGEYRLSGLQPGFHRVMVTAQGLSFDRRDWTNVADRQVVELDHELEPAGALQGIAAGRTYQGLFGITRVGAQRPDAIAKLLEGRSFTFGGLRPGTYILEDFSEKQAKPPVERGRAIIEAGRTAFVDLTDAPGPVELAGRVVDARGAVPSAVVTFNSVRRRVGNDGSFIFHSGLPIEDGTELSVDTGQFSEGFFCRMDAPHGGGWHGSLKLGDETLRIEVRDVRGKPVAGCVALGRGFRSRADVLPSWIRTRRLALDANGSLTIEHLEPGHYGLHVSAPSGIELATTVDLPRADVLQLELAEGGELVVHLAGSDGAPVKDWYVTAFTYLGAGELPVGYRYLNEEFVRRSTLSQRDGVARLAHVRSGKIVLEAEMAPDLDADPPILPTGTPTRMEIELHPGETKEVELRVPARGGGRR
jgi:hypothetical protein